MLSLNLGVFSSSTRSNAPRFGLVRPQWLLAILVASLTLASAAAAAPTASNDWGYVYYRSMLSMYIVGNDYDSPTTIDPTTVNIVSPVSHGALSLSGNGAVLYTPDTTYVGWESFSYTVNNSAGETSNAALVSIYVMGPNPPTANDDSAATSFGTPVSISVLSNDWGSGAPLDPSRVTIVSQPVAGNVVVDANGNLQYTPDLGFAGFDFVEYKVFDYNGLASNIATVEVYVGPNQAPVVSGFDWDPGDGSRCYFYGTVDDENPGQLVIQFGGVLDGHSVNVRTDGTFFYRVEIPYGVDGPIFASTTDEYGNQSNVAQVWFSTYP